VKSNLGHLDSAAGVAGFIKTVLALENRQIPPSLHFDQPNPEIDFAASPFRVVDRLTAWEPDGAPRRAGVSSFGIGGTNAHAVLEEAPPAVPSGPSRPRQLLLLSARSAAALEEATANLAAFLDRHPEVPLADVAFTLRTGRHPFEHRRMLVCESREDALAALETRDPERLLTRRRESREPAVAWLLPGQGSQHAGMGRELYETEPVFRREVDACAEILAPRLGLDLREVLFSGTELTQTRLAQPALFVVEHALARLWLSWGIRPRALLGHSLGEYVAACLAGVLTREDALELVAARGELMQELPPGAMLSLDLTEAEALAAITAIDGVPGLALAAVNGPGQCVVSGPEADVAALAERLAGLGIPARRLHTSHAFHSPMMEPVLDRFTEIVARLPLQPPAIPYVSNLTGTWITADEATDPRYWTRHLRETVRFGDGIGSLLAGLPEGAVLLEVGPGQALGRLVRRQAPRHPVIASMPHPGSPSPEGATLLQAAGRLWLAGAAIDWAGFHAGERRRRVPLPTYPFQRRRYWIEYASPAVRDRTDAEVIARLEASGWRLIPPPAAPAEDGGDSRTDDEAGHARPDLETPYVEPRTGTERRLAGIWAALLGLGRVGVHDDFFELGGHSLLATRLLLRVRDAFGREVSLQSIFDSPTVARLAARIDEEAAAATLPPLLPVPRTETLPPSFAQQRLLFLDFLSAGDATYNLPLGLQLEGSLDPGALQRALARLVERHEVLRTTFRVAAGQASQIIGPAFAPPLPAVDLSALPAAHRDAESRWIATAEARRPFDLARGPVLRALLLRRAPGSHVLLLTLHHIAGDGWSWGVLFREMVELYEAGVESRPARLPELPVQYADFAAWQRGWLDGEVLASQIAYWRRQLASLPVLGLPTDHPRPAVRTGRGAALPVQIPGEIVLPLRRLSRGEDATLFMALTAAFSALLHHDSQEEDLVVGTDVANRSSSATEGLIGLFVNQLVLRCDLSGDPTFRELLQRVRDVALAAFAHQDAPFDRLVEVLNPVRDMSRTPLFQVKIVLQNATVQGRALRDLSVFPYSFFNETAKFDLLLNLSEAGPGVVGQMEYCTDLFEPETIERMLARFATLLRIVAERPEARLSEVEAVLAEEERQARERRTRERQEARSRTIGTVRRRTVTPV
jgi:malonyl CoA-acyl carrier protein transacylase